MLEKGRPHLKAGNDRTLADINVQSGHGAVESQPFYQKAFSDPSLSGFGTWLGTLLSIAAAVVAYRQARAAKDVTAKLGTEQDRNAMNATLLHLTTIANHLGPLWDTTPRRGLKIPKIVADAKHECYRAIGSLSKERDGDIRTLLQQFEPMLDGYLNELQPRPANLDAEIRRQLQDLTSMCNDAIKRFAVEK